MGGVGRARVGGVEGGISAQIALAWLLHKGPDIVLIPGTKRRPYLEETVGAVTVLLRSLSAEDMAKLDAALSSENVAGARRELTRGIATNWGRRVALTAYA